MLKDHAAIATIAVRDTKRSADFYETTLGFERVESMGDEAVTYRSGNAKLFVYRSEFAGTNKATSASFDVGDKITSLVESLRGKGVAFEHYDMPGMTRDGDIHSGEGMKVAWFKDPDGNIINLAGR